jgi:hypothetical protein
MQVLLAQSNMLQVQMQSKSEEVINVRMEMGGLREQLQAHEVLNVP